MLPQLAMVNLSSDLSRHNGPYHCQHRYTLLITISSHVYGHFINSTTAVPSSLPADLVKGEGPGLTIPCFPLRVAGSSGRSARTARRGTSDRCPRTSSSRSSSSRRPTSSPWWPSTRRPTASSSTAPATTCRVRGGRDGDGDDDDDDDDHDGSPSVTPRSMPEVTSQRSKPPPPRHFSSDSSAPALLWPCQWPSPSARWPRSWPRHSWRRTTPG
jgi:hypothetical protein